jgi:purine-binding chemotaxis protein CheW
MEIPPLPNATESVRGGDQQEGKIIPVVDLWMRFGVEMSEYTDRACIVVVVLGTIGSGHRIRGMAKGKE